MGSGGKSAGQLSGDRQKFAEPMVGGGGYDTSITGMGGGGENLGERTGFITDGYIDKRGTPYGEAAKFNMMPPGMDISNQEMVEIHSMPLKKVVNMSYPGDGWGSEKDVSE